MDRPGIQIGRVDLTVGGDRANIEHIIGVGPPPAADEFLTPGVRHRLLSPNSGDRAGRLLLGVGTAAAASLVCGPDTQ